MSQTHESSKEPRSQASWDAEVRAAARLLGDAYAENADLRKQVAKLQASVDARELVELAKGVIMGHLEIDSDEAGILLEAGAGGDDERLRVAAAAVVAFGQPPSEILASVLRESALEPPAYDGRGQVSVIP